MVRAAYIGQPGAGPEVIDRLLDNPPQLLAADVETVSLKDRTPVGIGVATSAGEGYYFPVLPMPSDDLPRLLELLLRPSIAKVFHNGLFDLGSLRLLGLDLPNLLDTHIMALLLGLPRGLDELSKYLLDRVIQDMATVLKQHRAKTTLDLPYEVLARKSIDDVRATYGVYHRMLPYVDAGYLQREMALVPLLVRMSARGLRLDQDARANLEHRYTREADYYRVLCDAQGFNPGSPQQVGYILGQRGNFLPVKRVKSNGRARLKSRWSMDTSEEVLKGLADPFAAIVLEYRKVTKLLGTYIVPYAGQDRAYTRFSLATNTGRLASAERNLQNVPPGEVRGMFLPDNSVFTAFDFSQQELRTLAFVSGDGNMSSAFERGEDIHLFTATQLYRKQAALITPQERRFAKNGTFAMVYGGDDNTIMETVGIRDPRRARDLRQRWFAIYPQAGRWIELTQEQGLLDSFVRTLQGRKLYLPTQDEASVGEIQRKAVNYVIQGSAAEVTKDAMLRCGGLDLVLQVHDELVVDGKVSAEELRSRGIEDVVPFKVPVKVKHLERWE